jgi:VWFA-related protein
MTRFLSFSVFISAVLILTATAAHAQSGRVLPTPTPEKEERVKIATEEIKVNVLAFDEDGKFVDNVKREDLVITENNILHQPSSVRRLPANVLIVMDTGGELRWMKNLDKTRAVANGIVSALKPEDSIALIQYSDKAEVVASWTSKKDDLRVAIGKTKFGKRSSFIKALYLAKEMLIESPRENKHLILITDGTDSTGSSVAKQSAMRGLLASDITVHVMSYTKMEATDIEPRTKAISNSPPRKAIPDEVIAGLPNGARDVATAPKIGPTINLDRKLLKTMRARKADLEISEEQLEELADNTNGEMINPLSHEEMIEKTGLVASRIDSSYVVTYSPKIPLEESTAERNIYVSSKRPGLVVDAKRKLVVSDFRK